MIEDESVETIVPTLVRTLKDAPVAIRTSLADLSEMYNVGGGTHVFVEARRKLYSTIWMYGEYLHPSAIDVVTTLKEITQQIREVSDSSEVIEIIDEVAEDCRKALGISNDVALKFGRVMEAMEAMKLVVEKEIYLHGSSSNNRQRLQNPLKELSNSGSAQSASLMQAGQITLRGPEILQPRSLIRSWLGPVGSWFASGEDSPSTDQQFDSLQMRCLLSRSVDDFVRSLEEMYDVVQNARAILSRIMRLKTGNITGIDDNWSVFVQYQDEIVNRCKNLETLKVFPRAVLRSLDDRVDEKFRTEWLEDIQNHSTSQRIIVQ
jgi:hypothetical protein